MFYQKKFYLTGKEFLSVGLRGTEPEIRFSATGRIPLTLSLGELEILVISASSLLKESVELSTSAGSYGGVSRLVCMPDEDGGLKFVTEELPDAQPPLDMEELMNVQRYTLTKNCAYVLVEILPAVKVFADHIVGAKEDLECAYATVADQLKRLCATNPGQPTSFEHFLYILRLLHQYVPMSFLVGDFKRRNKGSLANVPALMNTVVSQFEYLYNRVFPGCG